MTKMKIKCTVLGPVSTNCYIVENNETKECVIIDPADAPQRIISILTESGVKPMAILLTHGHFDHIGAAVPLKQHYGIKIYANELEKDVLTSAYNNLSEMMGENSFMIEADDYLKDGGKLAFAGFDIQAVSTPGHTQGGMCYLVKCGTEKALFSGDTLFEGSVGRYDFPTSSGTALFANIKNKLLKLEDNLMVYPGHGQATTIGDERPNF